LSFVAKIPWDLLILYHYDIDNRKDKNGILEVGTQLGEKRGCFPEFWTAIR